MHPFVRSIFHYEINYQCTLIVHSANACDEASQLLRSEGVWAHVQAMLISAANISKILWGSSGKKAIERQPLRDDLEVDDNSPFHDPDLRNDFEHFDERLEAWFEDGHRLFVGRNIGPADKINAGPRDTWFHHYDPNSGIVSFHNHSVDLRAVLVEALRIMPQSKLMFETLANSEPSDEANDI